MLSLMPHLLVFLGLLYRSTVLPCVLSLRRFLRKAKASQPRRTNQDSADFSGDETAVTHKDTKEARDLCLPD
jgi:hypothetical protein